jgi:hypothetical protein
MNSYPLDSRISRLVVNEIQPGIELSHSSMLYAGDEQFIALVTLTLLPALSWYEAWHPLIAQLLVIFVLVFVVEVDAVSILVSVERRGNQRCLRAGSRLSTWFQYWL